MALTSQTHSPSIGLPVAWNNLTQGPAVIKREFQGREIWCFGHVESLEKLRNCHMLHFRVEVAMDSSGFETARYENLRFFGYRSLPATVKWKKMPGSEAYSWHPTRVVLATPPRPPRAPRRPYGTPSSYYAEPETPPEPSLDEVLKARKQRAATAHAGLLQSARDSLGEALVLLGLHRDSSEADFKRVQREVMRRWHPDRLPVYLEDNGADKTEEFRQQSSKFTDALALAREYFAASSGRAVSYET